MSDLKHEELLTMFEESIAASNRTTYAVRAIAKLVLWQTLGIIVGAIVFQFAGPFGAVVAVVGLVIGLLSGWVDLSESSVYKNFDKAVLRNQAKTDLVNLSDDAKLAYAPRQRAKWEAAGSPSLEKWDPAEESLDAWLAKYY